MDERWEKSTDIIHKITLNTTELLRMKRGFAEEFDQIYRQLEEKELRERRAELVKRWKNVMKTLIAAFAAASYVKDEIHRIDQRLGNEFRMPEEILGEGPFEERTSA